MCITNIQISKIQFCTHPLAKSVYTPSLPDDTCAQCLSPDLPTSRKHVEDCTPKLKLSQSFRKHNENGSFIINIQEREKEKKLKS